MARWSALPCRFLAIGTPWSSVLSLAVLLADAPEVKAQPAGSEFLVNTYTIGFQRFPSVGAGGNGDFVVAWESFGQDGNPLHPGIFGQRFTSAGAVLGSEFQVNASTLFNQELPKVAVDADGDFVAVYDNLGGDGSARAVFARRFSSAGDPLGTEFQVNSFTSTEQNSADIASDAAGNFVVVWGSVGQESAYGVFGQRYASTGAAVGSEFQVNTYTISAQLRPAVAFDADGDFVVVWESTFQEVGFFGGIFGQRYASTGNAIGSEFHVNTYTIELQWLADVASGGNGDFVAVWDSTQQDGAGTGIFGQRFASDGAPLGSEFQVNTYTQTYQFRPAITAESDGDFTVVWASYNQDGDSHGVFGQRYASSGAPIGTEFQVNSYTPGFQSIPAVAAQSDEGHFVVAWSPPPGELGDIFSRRYGPILCPPAPDVGCITGFAKGLLIIKELAGKEKVIAKLLNGPATAQLDFGNPTTPGGTGYNLCIYGDTSNLVAGLDVDRAGDATCSGGSKACWKAIGGAPPGGKGYKYKDKSLAAEGLSLVLLKGGQAGKAKIVAKGFGANLPLPIAAQLTSAVSVTVQLRGSDAPQCFSVTLGDVKKQDSDFFKAK